MKKIKYRILASFLITSSLFIILTGTYSIFNLIQLNKSEAITSEKMLFDDYDKMIKNEVETAVHVLNTYYNNYKTGRMSEAEAKDAAIEAMNELRYGTDGYFWIDSTNGVLIAHPLLPGDVGKNRIDIEDPNGVKLIQEVISAAKDNKNSGYTSFMWEKPEDVGTGKLSPKKAYSKLFEPWGWVVSTGNYVDDINSIVELRRLELGNNLQKNIFAAVAFELLSVLAVFIVGILLSKKISDPIIKLVKAFEKDSNGQISIQEIKLKSKDEIGLLANTLNELSVQIKGFVNGVIKESGNVAQSACAVEEHMSLLNEQIEEVSITTENISAGMEETAASTEEMNASAMEIAKAAESIAAKAQEGAASAAEISSRANTLKLNLTSAMENGTKMLKEARERLDSAIEESKSVTRINELADAILQITNQTNLLALNAAIEASRAGEAGRGFAVVADEIRKLAEDSKVTASSILDIIKAVTSSVDNLSTSSSQIMKFVATDVNRDYSLMLKASDEYNKDAEHLNTLVSDLSSTAEELNASIQNVIKAIEEVTSATNEGAAGTSNITQSIVNITEKSEQLLKESVKSRDYSNNLIKLVSKFKL